MSMLGLSAIVIRDLVSPKGCAYYTLHGINQDNFIYVNTPVIILLT